MSHLPRTLHDLAFAALVVVVFHACFHSTTGVTRSDAVEVITSTQTPARKTTTGRRMAELLPPVAGLPHLAKISDKLYRGAQPTAAGYHALAAMGVKTVICLRRYHHGSEHAEAAGLAHVSLPMRADIVSNPPSVATVEAFFDTVLAPANQPVFFHCKTGKDRTGTMAALSRIEIEGWTSSEAVEEMKAFGYHSYFRDLVNFVRKYKPRGFKAKD